MVSRFLSVVWITTAAIVIVMLPASRLMQGTARLWGQAAVFAAGFLAFLITFILNRATQGLWLPGKDGQGTSPSVACGVLLFWMLLGYLTLQALHVLPW